MTTRIPLFTQQVYDDAQSKVEFPFECNWCSGVFYVQKRFIKSADKTNRKKAGFLYCSQSCFKKASSKKIKTNCCQCQKPIEIQAHTVPKSGRNFCSQSCAATYNNSHKTTGYRRSKFEIWLESELIKEYPFLEFKFNSKTDIDSELDIYIPSLKLAFEINGIFHYQPIYGQKKFYSTQANDELKIHQCRDNNIKLSVFDISSIQNFKPAKGQLYLEQIIDIIDSDILLIGGRRGT